MNLANRLTLLRVILVPFFVACLSVPTPELRLTALIIFVVAGITDYFDGIVARRTKTVTVLGTFLDPLVDKIMMAAAFISFIELPELNIPAWMVVLIVGREFIVTGLRSLAAAKGMIVPAERAGKIKTSLQMIIVILILLILILNTWLDERDSALWGLRPYLDLIPYWGTFLCMVFGVISGFIYVFKYQKLLQDDESHH